MNHSQALRLALDALGKFSIGYHVDAVELNDLIATLEAALEQDVPETDCGNMEPVAWLYPEGLEALQKGKCWTAYGTKQDAQCSIPLFAHPPRREWRGLSKDESLKLWGMRSDGPSNLEIIGFSRAIEAALKERNA
jgi:hypothetical protein